MDRATWRNQNILLRTVLKKTGKRLIERPRMGWENIMKIDVKKPGGGTN